MKKYRTLKPCLDCGKPFYGSAGMMYCDACRTKRKRNVIRTRICKECGTEFEGGPRARRCPECAEYARTHHKREKTKRPLGSIDKCEYCGAEYRVNSGRQKYCSEECQKKAVMEWQKKQKRGYAKESGQEEKKRERREKKTKICIYCMREFKNGTSSNVCSEYCREKQRRITHERCCRKTGRPDVYEREIEEREKYRKAREKE